MSTDAQTLLDTIDSDIGTFRSDAVTALTALSTFRPTTFSPNLVPLPTLEGSPSVHSPAFVPIDTINTNITDPNHNPYSPLTVGALPQYQKTTVQTDAAAAFANDFKSIIPTLFGWLYGQIQAIVGSGGQNIAPAIQQAIFDSGRERDLQALNDTLDLAGARTGAKGCRYANSMTKSVQAQALLTYQYQKADTSRKIIEVMANMAQDNLKMAIGAGISIDQAKVTIFNQTASVLADIERLTLEQYKADLTANLQQFESQLKLQLLDLQAQVADRDEMRAFISAEREQLLTESKVKLSEFEAKNKIQELQFGVDKLIADLSISRNEQTIRAFSAYVTEFIEVQRTVLSEVQQRNTLQAGLLKNVADGYSKIMQAMTVQGVAIVNKKSS